MKRTEEKPACLFGKSQYKKAGQLDKPGCIIAGRPNQLQARVSQVLSTHLLPLLEEFPTILKNSFDLVVEIQGQDCTGYSFVIVDFVSLYTSIPLADLYETIRGYNLSILLTLKLKESTIAILKFIFNHNFFEFASEYYRQTDGIAMGTNVAPILANIYLAIKFDKKIINLERIKNFRRFIDDCFFQYKGTKEEFINNELTLLRLAAHPIELTFEFSNISVDFLDVTVFNSNNTIAFKVFQKPLNQYHYIPQFSNHPGHNLTGFIKGELIRYRRLSTFDADFNYLKRLFYERLIQRGYTKNILNPVFSTTILPGPTIEWYTPQHYDTFNLALRYSNQPEFIKRLKTELDQFSSTFNNKFNEHIKIRIAFKSNPNILQLTSRSRLSKEQVDHVMTAVAKIEDS